MADYAYHPLGEGARPGHKFLPAWKLGARHGSLSNRLQTWCFYSAAAVFGLILQLLLSKTLLTSSTGTKVPRLALSSCPTSLSDLPLYHPNSPPHSPVVNEPYVRPGLGHLIGSDEDTGTFESLRDMVSRTKGYYARDFSVWLGWNNVCF